MTVRSKEKPRRRGGYAIRPPGGNRVARSLREQLQSVAGAALGTTRGRLAGYQYQQSLRSLRGGDAQRLRQILQVRDDLADARVLDRVHHSGVAEVPELYLVRRRE